MRNRVLALRAASIALMTLALPASAVQPIRTTVNIDVTLKARGTSIACGYDVYRHIVGTFTVTAIQRDGNVVKEIDGSHHATFTWFAPANGTSYSYPQNSPVTYLYPEGGTVGAPAVLIFHGLAEKIPGAPAASGQEVFQGYVAAISDAGIPEVITDDVPTKLTGSAGGTLEDRCNALDPR